MLDGPPTSGAAGALMAAEISEQPQVWAGILADGRREIAAVAEVIRGYQPRFVMFIARGSSDHAALYAKYLVEIALGLPAGLASPSTMTTYGARPDLRGVLVVGVSQSGGSPDLVRSLEIGRAQGALTLSVTNSPGSALAEAAELHLSVRAGPERAVAATKSYTAQLLTLFMLVDRLRGGNGSVADELPRWGTELLAAESAIHDIAVRYRFAQRLVVTGRGYSYPTAREAALKLMETSYISAQAFSAADLLHGPLAMIDAQVPVLTVIADGPGGRAMRSVLPRLLEVGADVLVVGHPAAAAEATIGVELPPGIAEELSPIVEILPFQQLALQLAIARGENPDAPRGLRKVTETL